MRRLHEIDRASTHASDAGRRSAAPTPTPATPTPVAALGNQALLRLIAPTTPPIQALGGWRGRGRDDDRFEREAHRAADHIATGAPIPRGDLTATAGAATGLEGVHPAIESAIDRTRGAGRPLPGRVRRSLSSRLGADLDGVRVHTDDRAHGLSERLNARAFASGRDVFFRRGAFDPDSRGGRDVLHHELSHVVQQCGRRPDGALGRASRPTIQRFIMQIGADDGYTATMSEQLKGAHPEEGFLQFKATWDPGWTGFGHYGEYDPQSTKRDGWSLSRSTSRKLKGVPDGEPLRIVAHGNIRGMVGGYTADRMFALLSRLGLPRTHTGGIDLYSCLPGSPYRDTGGTVDKQPHIVQLQDLLTNDGRTEVVRGYVHTINPGSSLTSGVEVDARGYGLYADVVKPLYNLGINRPTEPYTLSDEQIETIRDHLGAAADGFFATLDDGKTVKRTYAASITLRTWLEKNGLYHHTARLRRAESVRMP